VPFQVEPRGGASCRFPRLQRPRRTWRRLVLAGRPRRAEVRCNGRSWPPPAGIAAAMASPEQPGKPSPPLRPVDRRSSSARLPPV
jgi:hypothetical protein